MIFAQRGDMYIIICLSNPLALELIIKYVGGLFWGLFTCDTLCL